jgi:RNA polymerase sigma factor (sigma-70 family)
VRLALTLSPKLFEQTDWTKLSKRLLLKATLLTRAGPAVFDCGISAEDLVSETLEQFFESPNALNWSPEKSKLETFLCMILQRRFIDHWRRQQHTAGSLDDETTLREGARVPMRGASPYEEAEYNEFAELLRREVKGCRDLEDLITASEMIHDGQKVNQQLAEILDCTPAQVVNLKKQLLRNRGVRELYERRRQS